MTANTNAPWLHKPENKDLKLWRYMDFTKFVAMLASSELFFCRSDRVEDPYEGCFSNANLRSRSPTFQNLPNEENTALREQLPIEFSILRSSREWLYINCWHSNTHESAAMWKLYAQTDEAVAIETDYKTFVSVLPDFVNVGLVNYVNYETYVIPEDNVLVPIMHKCQDPADYKHALKKVRGVPCTNF